MESHTVDLTPTWSGILRVLLHLYAEGSTQQRDVALTELQKMASVADMYVLHTQTHASAEDAWEVE